MHFYVVMTLVSHCLYIINNQAYFAKSKNGQSLFKLNKYMLWRFNELHGILAKEED